MDQGDSSTKWSAGLSSRVRHVRMPEDTNVWTPDATTFKCPACGSHDTRKSFPKGPLDYFVIMFSRWPYRCRKCSHRFIRKVPRTYATEFLKTDKMMEDEPDQRHGDDHRE